MTGKRWLLAAAAAILLAGTGSGCATCCHQACRPALNAGPTCELPLGNRGRAYAVFVNGVTPDCGTGLTGLRDKLACEGFTKVYYGQVCHAPWLVYEMRQVHKDDPEARFVVVGYDLGGPVAAWLARNAAEHGIPVDALVLLDPTGHRDTTDSRVRTILVYSGAGAAQAAGTETIAVPDAGHFTLPTHPATVELVGDLLRESAGRVPTPQPVPAVEWSYEFAPPGLRTPTPGPNDDPAWHFLIDVPGPKTTPLLPFEPAPSGDGPGKSSALPWPRKLETGDAKKP